MKWFGPVNSRVHMLLPQSSVARCSQEEGLLPRQWALLGPSPLGSSPVPAEMASKAGVQLIRNCRSSSGNCNFAFLPPDSSTVQLLLTKALERACVRVCVCVCFHWLTWRRFGSLQLKLVRVSTWLQLPVLFCTCFFGDPSTN